MELEVGLTSCPNLSLGRTNQVIIPAKIKEIIIILGRIIFSG